jgi:hypothetical protein
VLENLPKGNPSKGNPPKGNPTKEAKRNIPSSSQPKKYYAAIDSTAKDFFAAKGTMDKGKQKEEP